MGRPSQQKAEPNPTPALARGHRIKTVASFPIRVVRVCRVQGIWGFTSAARAARPLYSGAGEAGMLGGDLPRRNAGPSGRMGGLGEAVLVAGTEAVLRPAQPRKLE